MSVPSYNRGICSTYRLSAIRVCCAFRTISDDAALVISGMVPINELAIEADSIFKAVNNNAADGPSIRLVRAEARQRSIDRWQNRWDCSRKGRWTHRLIPNLAAWLNRQHGEVNFYITQVLSGHGCIRSYLKRFGHDASDECPSCSRGTVEDAKHVVFKCPRFAQYRQRLEVALGGPITEDNLVIGMLESASKWEATGVFAASVTDLRKAERIRRGLI